MCTDLNQAGREIGIFAFKGQPVDSPEGESVFPEGSSRERFFPQRAAVGNCKLLIQY